MRELPIEPGCRAISIAGAVDVLGHEMYVADKIPDGVFAPCCGQHPIFLCYPTRDPAIIMKGCDKCLLRIDGHDFSHEAEREKVEATK